MTAVLLTALMLTWSAQGIVKDYVQSNYPWPEVQVQGLTDESTLPDTPPSEINLLGGMPGRTVFLMKFPSGESVEYHVNVEAFDYVININKPLRKGEIIEMEDIYKALVNVRKLPRGAITRDEDIVGKALRYTLPANRTITVQLVEEPALIKRGQNVTIVYENKNLSIRAIGTAKQDGTAGSRIRVMSAVSKKPIQAIVVDSRTVRVEE